MFLEKAGRTSSHFLDGHNEERLITSQPRRGRRHPAGTGQTALEVIGSKRSYALNWCKPMMMMMMMMPFFGLICPRIFFRSALQRESVISGSTLLVFELD